MSRQPTPYEVLKFGQQIARLKASMPPKRWHKLVQLAHSHGYTVAGQLSGAPKALRERTPGSLRKEAQTSIAKAYAPVYEELGRRESAIQALNAKRATDDQTYKNWLMGEAGKLDAQARAADATIARQQSDLATENQQAFEAAQADSRARMAQNAGNVSDPSQSTALDYSDAAEHSREQVANQRQLTTDLAQIGESTRDAASRAVLSAVASYDAQRNADTFKAMAEVASARGAAKTEQAGKELELLDALKSREMDKAQSNREFAAAAQELGFKQTQLATQIKQADREFRLQNRKFRLDRWKAEHADAVAQAKIQLGYDEIKSREGQKAADRALDQWIERYKARHDSQENAKDRKADGKKGGATDAEQKASRDMYRSVETVRHLIMHKRQNGKDDATIRQDLVKAGYDNVTIDVANDLTQNNNAGLLGANGIRKAKALGILHPGRLWGIR